MRSPAIGAVHRSLLALTLACALHPTPARADEPASEAQQHFERGLSLSAQKRWPEARDAFLESARLTPRASTYYNLAMSAFELGQGRAALAALARFDELAKAGVPAEHVALAAELRARALAHVGVLRLTTAPEGAVVEIDGEVEPVATSSDTERLIWLDPGPHALRVSAEGRQPVTVEVSAAARTTLYRRVELPPASAPELATTPVAAPQASVTPPSVTQLPNETTSRVPLAPVIDSRSQARAERDDGGGSLWSEPWTWIVIGAVVAAGAAGGVLLATSDDEPGRSGYGGTTGVTF